MERFRLQEERFESWPKDPATAPPVTADTMRSNLEYVTSTKKKMACQRSWERAEI